MKRTRYFWVSVVLLTALAVVCSGCMGAPMPRAQAQSQASSSSQSAVLRVENRGNFGEHTFTPAKDFESVGLVFTENTFTSTPTEIDGEIFTYNALLREAQRLGADAIINVVIDKKIIDKVITEETGSAAASATDSQASRASQRSSTTESVHEETWYGSALAINYTTLLRTTNIVTTGTGADRVTTQSEQIIFTGGGTSGGTSSGGGGGAQSESGEAESSGTGLFGGLLGRR